MKIFLIALAAGAALFAFSSMWSFLGVAASKNSDTGIVAGAAVVIVIVAAMAAFGASYFKRVHGSDKTKEEK